MQRSRRGIAATTGLFVSLLIAAAVAGCAANQKEQGGMPAAGAATTTPAAGNAPGASAAATTPAKPARISSTAPHAPMMAVLVAESGGQSPLGIEAGRGARVAAMQRADAPLAIRVLDTQSAPTNAARVAGESLGGAALGIGFTDNDPALLAVPRFVRAGKPFIVIGATNPTIPERCGAGVFLACFGDDAQGAAGARFGAKRFGTRAAIVTDSSRDYPRGLAGYFRAAYGLAGGTVVIECDLAKADRATIGAMLSGKQGGLDFVYLAAEPDGLSETIAAIRGALPGVAIVGGDGLDCAAVRTAGGRQTDRIFFTTHAWFGEGATPQAQAFARAYEKQFGAPPPNGFAALGFDAANLAYDAAARSGAPGDPVRLRQAIAATRGFVGASGTIDYSRGPVPAKDIWMIEVAPSGLRLAERIAAATNP
jgi:branched-chain amino acid transport system substrate-binding protein